MKLDVEMSFSGIRFPKKENVGDNFPACASFTFTVMDKYCPFCGHSMHNGRCCCRKFNKALKKLQESIGDVNHDSRVRTVTVAFASSFFDITHQPVDKNELNFDLFDDAFACKDIFTDERYLVSKGESDDDIKVEFYIKVMSNKQVYKVTAIRKPDDGKMEYPEVNLIVSHEKMTPGVPGVYGSSHPYHVDETIKTYGYDEFLNALQQMK